MNWAGLAEKVQEDERELFLLQWADALEEQGEGCGPPADSGCGASPHGQDVAEGLRWLAAKGRWPLGGPEECRFYLSEHTIPDGFLIHWIPWRLIKQINSTDIRGRLGEVILKAARGLSI